jgi:hypothetical protein
MSRRVSKRRPPAKSVEEEVLVASGRRCCLCVYLNMRDEVRRGQVAHLNGDHGDSRYENLVFLCLEHHDEYDGRTSQSKGITEGEVRRYRDLLYARRRERLGTISEDPTQVAEVQRADLDPLDEIPQYATVKKRFPKQFAFLSEPWKFPRSGVANEPQLFAYKSPNGFDGVCMIERIDLPDGRIVVACMAMLGNPGMSITNCLEELCFQVCARLEIPAERLVWLEHYGFIDPDEWLWVTFARMPPDSPFEDPTWGKMTLELWREVRLRPKNVPEGRHVHTESKLEKLFDWPRDEP